MNQAHTQASKFTIFRTTKKDLLEKKNITFWHMYVPFLHLFFGIPFDVQDQHFIIIGHVAVKVANYVTTPQTASIAILKVSALTHNTLKSVCIFSILFSRHFLRCWHEELIFDSQMIWWGEIRCQLFLVVTRLNSGRSTLQFR